MKVLAEGRGQGPPTKMSSGKRVCHLVITYKRPKDAFAKAEQLEKQGIMAKVRKFYSHWCVYRCGTRKSSRQRS